MIDLKQEAAKFKPIEIETGDEAPELDNASKSAIGYYNKALDQINSDLEDMAKANLKRAVAERPDFSHAICLLAACMLAKGDRLGVVKLSSSVSDPDTKKVVSPYIDYLFGEYDRVEYTKEKKERSMPSIGNATESGISAVYVNNEGRKQPKPFSDEPIRTERSVKPQSGVEFDKPPFGVGRTNESRTNDFNYSENRRSRNYETIEDPDTDIIKSKPGEKIDRFSAGESQKQAFYFGREDNQYRSVSNDRVQAKRETIRKMYEPESPSDNSSVRKEKTQSSEHKKYTKEEIQKNRIVALSILAAVIVFIVMIIIMCDQARQIKKLKKQINASSAESSVVMLNE